MTQFGYFAIEIIVRASQMIFFNDQQGKTDFEDSAKKNKDIYIND